jgi:hypothetical protein
MASWVHFGRTKEARMRDLLIVALLYVVVLVLFRWAGGFASAGKAFSDWGRWSATVHRHRSSPHSS